MKGSEFFFDNVHLLYYKCYTTNPNCGRSYIDCPDSIKNKKATINLINKKDNEYFQYAVAVTLNYEEIWKYSGRMFHQKKMIGKYLRKIM